MRVSASIYSNPEKSLEDLVKELDNYHVDYLHVDCNDELSVFEDIKRIRRISNTPIDLHIITNKPKAYFDKLSEYKVEVVCFQHENLEADLIVPTEIQSKLGVAITNDTPVEVFSRYFDSDVFSFGLLMTTTPGKSGGAFNPDTFERIREFKSRFPSKRLHIDGGVNNEVAEVLRNEGVYCSVSGSYLVKSTQIGEALMRLKTDLNKLDFNVKDLMMRPNELPILNLSELTFENVIRKISQYRLAFCLILSNQNELLGIITDGDLRRSLLDNINGLEKLNVLDMLNKKPLFIESSASVSDAFSLINSQKKRVMFLPVLGEKSELLGVVSINQLIKENL